MKIRSLILVTMLVVAVFALGGCGAMAPPNYPEQLSQASSISAQLDTAVTTVASLKAAVDDIKASAATMPANVAKATESVDQALTKIDGAVSSVSQIANDYKAQVVAAKTADDQRQAQMTAIISTINAAPKIVHDVAPDTPADKYAGLAAAIATAVVAVFGIHRANGTADKAITTPGTTTAGPPTG